MRTRTLALIGLAVAGIYAASVHAQSATPPPWAGHHHRHMMGQGPGRLIHLLLKSTDLTADQQTQAHQLLDANRQAVQPMVTQLRQANKDLATMLLAPQVQTDAVATQQALITQLQQQLRQHETDTVMALRGMLTADQLSKANAALAQKSAWHDGKPCAKTPAN